VWVVFPHVHELTGSFGSCHCTERRETEREDERETERKMRERGREDMKGKERRQGEER
jgi:hypothetical protein